MSYIPAPIIQDFFKNLLENKVNLNSTRVDRIKSAEEVLSGFISNIENFKNIYTDTIPQGSYRQKTIIKPVGEEGEFDVDLLIVLKNTYNWEPKQYLEELAATFKDTKRYEDLTDTYGKTRCVTIGYEGDFHVDLVPAIEDGQGGYLICNKKDNKFEKTDGDGYARWFDSQDKLANNFLIPVVRMVKYLRDRKEEFNTKSIILTTIAGMCALSGNSKFTSLPEAFAGIVGCMSEYLSKFELPPFIQNPAMPGETFERHWQEDVDGFKKFKLSLNNYAELAAEAISCNDQNREIKIWQEIFGDKFSVAEEGVVGSGNNYNTDSESFVPASPWSSLL